MLGVAFYNSADLVARKGQSSVSQRGARAFWFWVAGRERGACRRSRIEKEVRVLALCLLCATFTKRRSDPLRISLIPKIDDDETQERKTARDCSAHSSFLTLCTLPKPATLQRYLSSWRLELWARVAMANPCTLPHSSVCTCRYRRTPLALRIMTTPNYPTIYFSMFLRLMRLPGGLAEVLPSLRTSPLWGWGKAELHVAALR